MRKYFLLTERLGFSHWKKDDAELAYSLWGNKNVTKYLSASGTFTVGEVTERLKLEIDNEKIYSIQYWPVFELETGGFAGCCGLRPYKSSEKIYEIGFHLIPEYWGKGYGKEAAEAKFVEEYGLGITVNSLDELGEKFASLSEEEYFEMVKHVAVVSERLKNGYYLTQAIKEIEEA